MTILEWLKSKSAISLNDNTYIAIIQERGEADGIEETEEFLDVSTQLRELMMADMYMILYAYPTQMTRSITDSGFAQSESAQVGTLDRYLDIALGIYKKYGDEKYDELTELNSTIGGFKIKSRM